MAIGSLTCLLLFMAFQIVSMGALYGLCRLLVMAGLNATIVWVWGIGFPSGFIAAAILAGLIVQWAMKPTHRASASRKNV